MPSRESFRPKKNNQPSFDLKVVQKLGGKLRQLRLNTAPIRTKTWCKEIELLRSKHSKKEIFRVLSWYIEHIQDAYTPHAFSAKSFREKFDQLCTAMNRDPDSVELSEEAKEISALLLPMYWPHGTDVDIGITVQRSLDLYTPFYKRISDFALEPNLTPRTRRILDHILFHRILPPRLFILNWMRAVRAELMDWSSWKGSLFSFVCDPRGERFQKMGRMWAYRYCHDSSTWDKLLKEMT